MSIEPTEEQLGRLMADAREDDAPVSMLNLLRFRDRGSYERYGREVLQHLERVGASVLTAADCAQTVIGPDGERWDMMLLVRYPSRTAFLEMIADPGYPAIHGYREAALEDSRLICCM
jgi:uncharacterized protein (DUF1330 family)